jgi:hypothetical protein
MHCLLSAMKAGLLFLCFGCNGVTSGDDPSPPTKSNRPAQPAPATFRGVGSGYQGSD